MNGSQQSESANAQSLQFAVKAAGIGIWDLLLTAPWTVVWDERCRELSGIAQGETIAYEETFQLIHPDDRSAVDAAVKDALAGKGGGHYDTMYRVIGTSGKELRWLRSIGNVFFDDAGKAVRFSGILMDYTEKVVAGQRAAAAEQLTQIAIKGSGVGLFHINLTDNSIEYTPAFAAILTGEPTPGLRREDLLRHIHPEDVHIRARAFEGNLSNGDLYYEARTIWKDGSIRWIRTVGTAVFDAQGKPTLFSGTVQDITEHKEKELALKAAEDQFRTIVQQAPVAIGLFSTREMIVEQANQELLDLWGKDESIIGLPLAEAFAELKDLSYITQMQQVFDTGLAGYHYSMPARLARNREKYLDIVYTPIRTALGTITGIMVFITDVTAQVTARRQLEESELFNRSIVHHSPVAKMVFLGEDMVISMANELMLQNLGRNLDEVLNKPLLEALPELADTPLPQRMRQVLATGETYEQPEEQIMVMRHGKPHIGYYSYIYKALTNTAGERYGIIATAADITAHVMARHELEASKNRLKSFVEAAPFPIGVYTGREMRIELANQSIIDIWAKGNDVIGKCYTEILPELQNQEIFEQLDAVYMTGYPFRNRHQRVDIQTKDGIRAYYFNYDFTPLFDAEGKVYGVMNTAADVTDLVSAKQQVEKAEEFLRSAIELAELGTWTLDVQSRIFIYSERIKKWFGLEGESQITSDKAYTAIREEDRPFIREAMAQTLAPGSDGLFDLEFTVVNLKNGRERILHAQGKVVYDHEGVPVQVSGTSQDVTAHRQIQLALEQEVQERTEELQALNEELVATNEELHESNEQLQHSNEELAQYAYVASHDLQEPLRKIRMFSGMLSGTANLPEAHRKLVDKISQSSGRMTQLIRDLLEFSRLLKTDMVLQPVNLNEVIRAVVDDFELTISEKQASIDIGALPVIEGVSLQMNQLFYNLLSNALKFSASDRLPAVRISAEPLAAELVPTFVQKPIAGVPYFRISFADNGIGFERKYTEQIFEVFKRLHGKEIYPGSGIGLALCRRIANNHNGYLYATSEPGQGTTFYIILPAWQSAPAS